MEEEGRGQGVRRLSNPAAAFPLASRENASRAYDRSAKMPHPDLSSSREPEHSIYNDKLRIVYIFTARIVQLYAKDGEPISVGTDQVEDLDNLLPRSWSSRWFPAQCPR